MKIDWEAIVKAVERAECVYSVEGSGALKRAFAIEIIDAVVNLPFPLSLFERRIYGWFIDFAVFIYNRWFGKTWVKRLKPDQVNAYQALGVK